MDIHFPASVPMKSPTNSLAVFALALSLLPTLTYFATRLYFRSSFERLLAFFNSDAGAGLNQLWGIGIVSALLAVGLAAMARRRRPGFLSDTAFVTALVALLCLTQLPGLFPLRIR